MKPRFLTSLVSSVFLFALLLAATDAAAGKPVKPPPEDSCSSTSFVPDFAFWRNTGVRKKPKATIYLAESATGCEKVLNDFSVDGFVAIEDLKYSSVAQDSGLAGRAVWISRTSVGATIAWKQDFQVIGSSVQPDGGPITILEGDASLESIRDLDLSHDRKTLVFRRFVKPTPEYYFLQLRLVDVDSCAGFDPCSFDSGVVLGEIDGSPSEVNGDFYDPSWGPYGDRIYVARIFPDPGASPLSYYTAIQYLDLAEGWQTSGLPGSFESNGKELFSMQNYLRHPVSGIMADGREYLAVEKTLTVYEACEYIYLIDVDSCAAGETCIQDPEFAGSMPSWTKDGRLIHGYGGWEATGSCAITEVGVWDGSNDTLRSLLDGTDPDAAGGWSE